MGVGIIKGCFSKEGMGEVVGWYGVGVVVGRGCCNGDGIIGSYTSKRLEFMGRCEGIVWREVKEKQCVCVYVCVCVVMLGL